MTLQYVSDCCPVGCGSDVVLLKPLNGNPIFCYCDACGLSWSRPEETQFESGLMALKGPVDFAPTGVEIPSTRDTEELKEFILGKTELKYWATSIEELNKEIANTKT